MKKNNIIKSLLLAAALLPLSTIQAEEVEISNFDDYQAFVSRVTQGEDELNAKLTGDFNAQGVCLTTYRGTFDGNGHTIMGISNSRNYAGFVSRLYGTVKNLTIKNAQFEGEYIAGGIAAIMDEGATIENCSVYGSIESDYAGGIVGMIDPNVSSPATITNCKFYGKINTEYYGGGIVGYIPQKPATITGCECYGRVEYTVTPGNSDRRLGLIIGIIVNNSEVTLTNNYYNTATAFISNQGVMSQRAIGEINNNANVADAANQYEGKLLGYAVKLYDSSTSSLEQYTADKEFALEGELVTVTAIPQRYENYRYCIRESYPRVHLSYDPSVAQSRAAAPGIKQFIPTTSIGNDQYTFTMPAGNIIVEAKSDPMLNIKTPKQWNTLYNYDYAITEGYTPARYYKVVDGFKAYTVTDINMQTGTITLSEPLEYVLFNTPMLIERTDNSQEAFWLPQVFPEEAPELVCSEMYIGNKENKEFSYAEAFFLTDGVFLLCEESILPQGRCYIGMPDVSNEHARELHIVKGGETTGINDKGIVNSERLADAAGFYTIGGQLIAAPTKPGLYIKNGKKIVIK